MKKTKTPVKSKGKTAVEMLSNSGFGWMVKNILAQIFALSKFTEKKKKEMIEEEKKTKAMHKKLKKRYGVWVWRVPD